MWQQARIAFIMIIAMTLLTGIAYPLAITGLAQVLFPRQAHGSLIERGGKVIGSDLIGQSFTQARYFHGRPSAAGKDGLRRGQFVPAQPGANRSQGAARAHRTGVRQSMKPTENGSPIPVDLVTTSGSGLDPHITPAAALSRCRASRRRAGCPRIPCGSWCRSTPSQRAGLLGEPRVNVLRLNLALDAATNSDG